jgi:DNA-binding Lrp family transcriptional regulator
MEKIDRIDLQLLDLLQKDSSLSNKEIAAQLNMSLTPIYERIKRLKKKKIILKYVALVDRKKLNHNLLVLVGISLNQHLKTAVADFMLQTSQMSEIIECFHVTGSYDFFLKVVVQDMEQYHDFILNKLSEVTSLGHAESYFVMEEVKNLTAIPGPKDPAPTIR